jgi:two-component system, NarL family, invasion response regulator UvrY
LITAVKAVAAGEACVDVQTARALAMAQVNGESSPTEIHSEPQHRGHTHLYHVKQKQIANNQSELTLVALQWGLLAV